MKFRRKPVEVDAVQFRIADPATHEHVNFSQPHPDPRMGSSLDGRYWVQTLEGPLVVSDGDWIITGVKGEHYPCKPDIFPMIYEQV